MPKDHDNCVDIFSQYFHPISVCPFSSNLFWRLIVVFFLQFYSFIVTFAKLFAKKQFHVFLDKKYGNDIDLNTF